MTPVRLDSYRGLLIDRVAAERSRLADAERQHDDDAVDRYQCSVLALQRHRLDLERWCASLGPSALRSWYVGIEARA